MLQSYLLADVFIRLTVLLALGWLAYGWVSRRNPRWAVAAMRVTIAGSIVLPIVYACLPATNLAVLPSRTAVSASENPVPSDAESSPLDAALDRDAEAGQGLPGHSVVETSAFPPQSQPDASSDTAPAAKSDTPSEEMPAAVFAGGARDANNPGDEPRDDRQEVVIEEESLASSDPQAGDEPDVASGAPGAGFADRMARWLLAIWLAGAFVMIVRLIGRVRRTGKLLRSTSLPADALVRECRELARRYNLRRLPQIRVSDRVAGPCTAGWPTVFLLLPEAWNRSLSDEERRAVLIHELSHVAHRDSLWDLVAQMAAAVWWFHPLAWRLVSRHRLACEHRCDAVAAEWAGGFAEYRRMLAQWALRHHELQPVPAALSMADRSLLLRRLRWLEVPRSFGKLGRRRLAIFGMVALLLLGALGSIRLTSTVAQVPGSDTPAPDEAAGSAEGNGGSSDDAEAAPAATDPTPVRRPGVADIDMSHTTAKVIRVVDEQERPIAGAEVSIGWWEDEDGDTVHLAVEPVVANEAGEVTIQVPRGAARAQISAEAEGYARAGTQYWLSGEPTLKLQPGRIVRVRAVNADGEPLPEAIPILENPRKWPREFESVEGRPGTFVSPVVDLDRHWMRVVDGNGEGPILFSNLIDVTAAGQTDEDGTIVATLRPGARLTGRLDDSVPRPIEQGYVELCIAEAEGHRIPARSGWVWQDSAPVAEDGTFSFESLPSGGHVQLFALVEGYQSVKPSAEVLRAYLRTHNAGDPSLVDRAAERGDAFWPHLFPLPADAETIRVELPCVPTASLDVKVVNPLGQPIEGAKVSFNPNGLFLGGGLFIPGTETFTNANRVRSGAGITRTPMRTWAMANFLEVATDAEGIARVRNLPAGERESYRVKAEGYVMPAHPTSTRESISRYAIVELKGGETLRRTVTMERFVPRASRELLLVDHEGKPVPEITVTVTEVAFEEAEDDWEMWAVQRFGPVASATSEDDGVVRLDVPVEVGDRKVARLRVVVYGQMKPHAFVQRKQVTVPTEADGRVVALLVSDEVPKEANRFREVEVQYVDPASLLDESPKELLQQLVETPSLVLLKQLLREAGFDAATPLKFRPDRYIRIEKGRTPAVHLETEQGDRVVVLCDVRPKGAAWQVKPELRFPPEAAFVFDPADGRLIAMLGGWASARGSYCSVMVTNLGGTDDYFVEASAFEEHEPFKYVQQWTHLGREDKPALTVYGYANATAWDGKDGPAEPLAEFGYTLYEFNGEDIDQGVPGVVAGGMLVPRKIYWDGAQDTFIGPATQSYDGRPLYRVVTERSAQFQPLSVKPGDLLVAGGRRDYQNWHFWDVVVPKGNTAKLVLQTVGSDDGVAETVLSESELTPGLHELQLHIEDAEGDEGRCRTEIRIDGKKIVTQETVPRVPVANVPSVDGVPIARTAPESMDLLRRPTAEDGVTLVWRVTVE